MNCVLVYWDDDGIPYCGKTLSQCNGCEERTTRPLVSIPSSTESPYSKWLSENNLTHSEEVWQTYLSQIDIPF